MLADLLDGVLARATGGEAALRRAVDTGVDRIGIVAALVAATMAGFLPGVLLVAFLTRDLCGVVIHIALWRRCRAIIKTTIIGSWATACACTR